MRCIDFMLAKFKVIDSVDRMLVIATVLQVIFWIFVGQVLKPDFTITPTPPGKVEMAIISVGDEEFLYRFLGNRLQTAGDTFGETIPLKDYDYPKIQKWFFALDQINGKSDYVPSIAGMYFSQSQNVEHSRYVIEYLVKHADRSPNEKWRWYSECVFLAIHKLKDYNLAKEIGAKIAPLGNSVPLWAKVIVPFMLNKENKDICSAYDLISQIDTKTFEELANDKILSADGGRHNVFANIIVSRMKEITDNPDIVRKCIKRR